MHTMKTEHILKSLLPEADRGTRAPSLGVRPRGSLLSGSVVEAPLDMYPDFQ